MTDIKLLVAMHKAYRLPENALYYPIQVGGIHIPGMEKALRDNTGENISDKNKSYCELTALYWGWKNLPADYLGLVHYRRYFAKKAWAVRSLTGSQLKRIFMLRWKKRRSSCPKGAITGSK